MAQEKIDMKAELQNLRFSLEFCQKIKCSKEDADTYRNMVKNGEALPQGILQDEYDDYFTVLDTGLTEAEKQEYLQLLRAKHLRTIKNCVVFFTALVIIALILTVIGLFNS